ncbi:hydrogenase maturation protease [Pseudonocardia zijingensis]|uniref:Hydrogenase maturation protease n=1 Tax=Pseudonocardia zijingensis TaxID=153376 RepID=A0ABP3YJY2_9PSEU
MTAERHVLVAGIGNVFLGDDGFGVEVVRRIDPEWLPDGVVVADYGIRGMHLAYELLDGRVDTLVLVDAVPLDGPAGTVALLEVDPAGRRAARADGAAAVADAHGMDPESVLRLLHDLGGSVDRVLVVGCRPAVLDERMELSDAVAGAVDEAVALVLDTVGDLVRGRDRALGATSGSATRCEGGH